MLCDEFGFGPNFADNALDPSENRCIRSFNNGASLFGGTRFTAKSVLKLSSPGYRREAESVGWAVCSFSLLE